VGGRKPELAGKPYLLHFWATSCGPCKGDFPVLKSLAERGAVVVGMHPSGASAEEVEKVIRDHGLGYPTVLGKDKTVGEYPAVVFPYYILVEARGRVAGHGFLSELLGKF